MHDFDRRRRRRLERFVRRLLQVKAIAHDTTYAMEARQVQPANLFLLGTEANQPVGNALPVELPHFVIALAVVADHTTSTLIQQQARRFEQIERMLMFGRELLADQVRHER